MATARKPGITIACGCGRVLAGVRPNRRHCSVSCKNLATYYRHRPEPPPRPAKLWPALRAVLRESALPVATPDLVALVSGGEPGARHRVWAQLRYLESAGVVRRHRGLRRWGPCGRADSGDGWRRVTGWTLA